jgi:hypothetical protein
MTYSYSDICPSDIEANKGVIQFLENFYQVTDTPEAHEEYANQFTEDATLILASKTNEGHAGMSHLLMLKRIFTIA